MSFSFGAPRSSGEQSGANTSSAPAASGLFGSASAADTPKFSFGSLGSASADNNSSTPAGSSASVFGQPSSGDAPKAASSVFGSNTAPATGAAAPTPGLFGSNSSTTPSSTGSLFGASKPSSALAAAGTTPAGGGVLGSTGAAAPASGGMFGTPSATANKPASSVFGGAGGASNTGSILFGSTAAPSQGTPSTSGAPASGMFASTGNSLFGNKAESTPISQAATAEATPAKPMFSLASTTPAGAPPTDSSQSAAAPAAAQTTSTFGGGQTSSNPSSGGSVLFGTKTPAGSGTSTAGGLFASAAATNTPAPSTSGATPGAAGSLFASTKPAASTPAVSAAPAASSLFGAPAASTTSQPASTAATPAATMPTTTAPAAGSLFAAQPASQSADKNTPSTKPATQNGTPSALGASTSGPTSQIPRLKNKTMEDIVTRWASDLSKYQKEFKEQATVVSTWDRNLVDNGENIQKLYLDTFEAERASHEIERQLVAVESQQDELEAWLDRYESEVQDMFVKQIGPGEQLAGPDQERERTYKLAEKLTQQFDEKSRDLSKMVKEINDISGTLSRDAKAEDPLSQIVRVLNGHLTQLQWIDAHAAALQAKVAAAQKTSMALNSHYAGAENDAAESFYRSYMGRR